MRITLLLTGLAVLVFASSCGGGGGGGSEDEVLTSLDWNQPKEAEAGQAELDELGVPDLPPDQVFHDDGPGPEAKDAKQDQEEETGSGLPACPGLDGCTEEGARECLDGTRYQLCKKTDADCLAWKGPLGCGPSKTCTDGECKCEFEACGIQCCGEGQLCHNSFCCSPACGGKECGPNGCGGTCGECEGGGQCVNGSCACTPDCGGKNCGGDGCGGSCGDCDPGYSCWDDNQCHLGDCVPKCAGKVCGDNGCGGVCGVCFGCQGQPLPQDACTGGQCPELCCPQCEGKECGDDGCGALCGACAGNETCQGGQCVCTPACLGLECGPDGCGDYCGTCYGCGGIPLAPSVCMGGECPPVCCPQCAGKQCGPDGCGGQCGTCQGSNSTCEDGVCVCHPDCSGKACGPDGCGGACGGLGGGCPGATDQCVDGQCVCQPACAGKACGDNGCGGVCGLCPPGGVCQGGKCCQPACAGKQCGDDGCGSTCGTCPGGADICTAGVCVCQPDCIGKECGSDGCIGSCGACPGNLYECSGIGQCVLLCGNSHCDAVESCESCPEDCGVCSYVPDQVFLVDRTKVTPGELVMLQSLQGVLAQKKPRLWIKGTISGTWLTDLVMHYGVTPTENNNAWSYVDTFKSSLAGYILYDAGQQSENVAFTLAGLLKAVVITPDLEGTAQAHGLALVQDARGMTEATCKANYWSSLDHTLALEQATDATGSAFLRDLAVQRGALVYAAGDALLRDEVASSLDQGAQVLGSAAPGTESAWLLTLARNHVAPVPAAQASNLSILSRIVALNPVQKNHIQGTPVTDDGVHYVLLVMGGGQRLDWILNDFEKPNWWGSAFRGTFSMNWELAPALAELGPSVLKYLFGKESAGAAKDYFVSGPSGQGYVRLSQVNGLAGFAAALQGWVDASDLHVVTVENSTDNKQPGATGGMSDADSILALPNVYGVLYRDAATPDKDHGAIRWSQGKPTVAYRFVLRDDANPDHTPTAIADALNALPRQPREEPGSYSVVWVDPESYWGGDVSGVGCMNAVNTLVGNLQAGVKLLTAEEFFYHLRKSFGTAMVMADDALLAEHDLPAQMDPSEVRTVSVTMQNTGTNVWKKESGYSLGAVVAGDPFAAPRVDLPGDLTLIPGQSHTFTFPFTAPQTNGTYVTRWRMQRDGVGFFGEELFQAVGVGGPPTWIYEAETDLLHDLGRLEGDGWKATVLQDPKGYLCEGPMETRIPGGYHKAVFRLATDAVGSAVKIASIDVWDADKQAIVTSDGKAKDIWQSSFSVPANTYQDFTVYFTNSTGHRLEFRVYFWDAGMVKLDRVTVQ
jgi:hypothetical protein